MAERTRQMFRRNSKAVGAGVGAALVTLLVWLLSMASIIVPPDVQSALTILAPALMAWLFPANAPPNPPPSKTKARYGN